MPAGFRLSFFRNNVEMLIGNVDQPDDGDLLITFENEFDPFPRRVRLLFSPRSAAAQERINKIIIKNNWKQYIFKCKLDLKHLRFNTDKPADMPTGHYSVRLWIEDLPISHKEMPLRIRKEGGELRIEVPEDERRITIRPSFTENLDQEISGLLDRSASIDGLSPKEWLADSRPRMQRRACLFNILSVLRTSPAGNLPLIRLIKRIIAVLPDRIYAEVDTDLKSELAMLVETTNFYADWIVLPEHKNVVRSAGKNPDDYDISSFRQAGHPSMQFSISSAKKGTESFHYADIDLDLGNPLQDVVAFLVHISELFDENKTDHLALQDDLNVPPTATYLYYDVS